MFERGLGNMGSKASRVLAVMFAMVVAACGCAQCQQPASDDTLGADVRLYKMFTRTFGESTSGINPPRLAKRTPAAKQVAVEQADFEEVPAPAPPVEAEAESHRAHSTPPATFPDDVCCSTNVLATQCGCCPLCPLGGRGGLNCACLDCVKRRVLTRPEPGPPPIRYRPEMPPKFLPTPTEPVWPPARPDAPESWRGDIEVPFNGVQLISPGRD